jgi:hypothetical protein
MEPHCDDGGQWARSPVALQAGPSFGATQETVTFPISDTLFDTCTGELVDLSGTAHVVFLLDVTFNANGDITVELDHVTPNGCR